MYRSTRATCTYAHACLVPVQKHMVSISRAVAPYWLPAMRDVDDSRGGHIIVEQRIRAWCHCGNCTVMSRITPCLAIICCAPSFVTVFMPKTTSNRPPLKINIKIQEQHCTELWSSKAGTETQTFHDVQMRCSQVRPKAFNGTNYCLTG